MLVLGLLAERPANRYELDLELQRRFKSAELSRGTARYAIKKLLGDGHVRAQASSPRSMSRPSRVSLSFGNGCGRKHRCGRYARS